MRPIDFEGSNVILAKDQPEYQALPAHVGYPPEIRITSCWELSPEEIRDLIASGGRLWIQQLTFGRGFQPQLPSVEKPDGL